MRQFVAFLRDQNRIQPGQPRRGSPAPAERLLAAYDHHLDAVCGLAEQTRRHRQVCAGGFLRWRFGRRTLCWRAVRPKDVARFVIWRAGQLQPSSLRAWVADLRSFLRFLESSGRVRRGLALAVPPPIRALPPPPPSTLDAQQRRRFLKSFARSSPKGKRDYAMALCLSELALRSQEVAGLTLDDLDWRAMTVRLAQTKQRRQRLLPLPDRVAKAILNYLKRGRPATQGRSLFVHHMAPYDQGLTASSVRGVVRWALARGGIQAGAHILRHTWATQAHRRGAGLKLIADVLGHRSLESTQRYAHVHVDELRQVALPWPKIKL